MSDDSKRILVVDDEEDVQGLLCNILGDVGYSVESADDGAQALERIEASHPDLVLLDLMMPVMDGWEVLDRLRGRADAPPVVVLSAFGDRSRALAAGARACLSKPFEIRALLGTCQEVCPG